MFFLSLFFILHVIPKSLQEERCCPVPFRLSLLSPPRARDGSLSASVDGLQVDFLACLPRHSPITKITKQLRKIHVKEKYRTDDREARSGKFYYSLSLVKLSGC